MAEVHIAFITIFTLKSTRSTYTQYHGIKIIYRYLGGPYNTKHRNNHHPTKNGDSTQQREVNLVIKYYYNLTGKFSISQHKFLTPVTILVKMKL